MVTKTTSTSMSSNSTSLSKASKGEIIIRKARLTEAPSLGRLAAETYYNDALVCYLSPYRAQYYSHYERGFIQRSCKRMLDPRNLTFVAVSSSAPNVLVGYVQLCRLGDDEGAKRQLKSRRRLWLWVLGWIFWAYCIVVKWVVGNDKSANEERIKKIETHNSGMEKDYWVERKNRWYTQSCVVREDWQGKGVGKMLMAEVIARAESEGVVIGLEASEMGERLYLRVGFELLGRFNKVWEEMDENVGGIFMYTPVKMRQVKS